MKTVFKGFMYVFWLLVYAAMALSSAMMSSYPNWISAIIFLVWFIPVIGSLMVYGWCVATLYFSLSNPVGVVEIVFYSSFALMIFQDIITRVAAYKVKKYEAYENALSSLKTLAEITKSDVDE